jgi:hypothetical protein
MDGSASTSAADRVSRRDCLAGAAVLLSGAAPAAEARAAAAPPAPATLFLDDTHIARMDRLTRTLHRPTKRGAVLRSPNPTKAVQTRSAPAWDPAARSYKLGVISIDERLWQSADGLNWSPAPAPDLGVDHFVADPNDPDPARRFKAALTNRGFAVSPDAVHWTKLDVPPVPSSDESNLSVDPTEGLFIHTVKRVGAHGRAVALATSRDFRTWTDLGLVFQSDVIDQQRGAELIHARIADSTLQPPIHVDPSRFKVDVYNMGVFRYEGHYLGMPAMFHSTGPVPNYPNTDGFHVIQLLLSRDLKEWHRLGDRQTFIGPSRLDSGAYDLTQILPPSAPVVRGDELWFYYTGLKYRSTFNYEGQYPNGRIIPKPGLSWDTGGICLAVLRRDGFLSLDAGEPGGEVVTRAALAGRELRLNLDAGAGGAAMVELLDEGGQVLAASEPVTGDGVRLPVRWKAGADPARLGGRPVRVRIRLRSASLYALAWTP